MATSMVELGWTNPVLVDEQGGILAGHGRLLAARKLGLAEVPVIRFEHLSGGQKRACLIAANQLALQAGWSEDLLAAELAWLRDERFDLDLIGFDARSWSGCCRWPMASPSQTRLRTRFRNRRRIRSASPASCTTIVNLIPVRTEPRLKLH
jgi:ParB-like nuclease domain